MQKRYIILVVFAILAIVFFFNSSFPPVQFITSSVQGIFAGPKSFLYGVKSGGDVSESVLQKENTLLIKKIIDYEKVKKDNAAFRSQFETEATRQYKLLPASVIGFVGRFSAPTVLIIDKGNSDGIKMGMAVILKDELVGKIGKVSPNYSEILLESNSGFSTVGITTEGNVPGIINGQNDFILFDHIAADSKITVGEAVLSKGDVNRDGIGIPPGLIIGRISSVSHAASLPFQNAKVESKIVPARLSKVFIIIGL